MIQTTFRMLFLGMIVLSPLGSAFAAKEKPSDPVANPLYNPWTGQEGKTVSFQWQLRISGGAPPGKERVAEEGKATYTATKVTEENVSLEITGNPKETKRKVTISAQLPAKVANLPRLVREEEVTIGKTTYKCKVYTYETRSEAEIGRNPQGLPAQVTVWVAPKVPGGVVRRQISWTVKASYTLEETLEP